VSFYPISCKAKDIVQSAVIDIVQRYVKLLHIFSNGSQSCITKSTIMSSSDVRKPNFWFLKTQTKPNRSQKVILPKFRFPWLFSKPNLSHTNSQYLSHCHKALTFFTLRQLSDSKWSWNKIISRHHAIIQLILYSTWVPVTEFSSLHVFFCILQLIYKENRTDVFCQNRTETEPNLQFFLKNPFRTSLMSSPFRQNSAGWSWEEAFLTCDQWSINTTSHCYYCSGHHECLV